MNLFDIRYCQHNKYFNNLQIQNMKGKVLNKRQPLKTHSLQNWSSKRSIRSWTDQRIGQIKKKYESTKINLSSQLKQKRNRDKNNKENYYQPQQNRKSQFNSEKLSVKNESNHLINQFVSKDKMINLGTEPQISSINSGLSQYNQNSSNSDSKQSRIIQHYPFSCLSHNTKRPEIKSVRLHTDSSNFLRSKQPFYKIPRVNFYDSRMQNIDRINTKIRKILNSIDICKSQQQKNVVCIQQFKNTTSLGRSVVSRCEDNNPDNSETLEETTILEKKEIHYLNDKNCENKSHLTSDYRKYSPLNNKIINQRQQQINRATFQQVRNRSLTNLQRKEDFIRSFSCFQKKKNILSSSMLKNLYVSQNQTKIKQIQQQINRFNCKIQELQNKKIKINLHYTPYNHSHSKKINLQHVSNSKDSSKNISYKQVDNIFSLKDITQNVNKGRFNEKSQFMINNIKSLKKLNYYQKYDVSAIPIKLKSQQKSQMIIDYEQLQLEDDHSNDDHEKLRIQILKNMAQRHNNIKQEKNSSNINESQLIKLVNALCKQITLDEELRNSKNWFSQVNNPKKIQQLQQQFLELGVNITAELVKEQFCSNDQKQTDPFFSFRQEKYSMSLVAKNYLQAHQFWNSFIIHQWNAKKLIYQEKIFGDINKGQVTIEDLVRLINTSSSCFFRNRDLYLIYKRIKKRVNCIQQTLSLEQFCKVLDK